MEEVAVCGQCCTTGPDKGTKTGGVALQESFELMGVEACMRDVKRDVLRQKRQVVQNPVPESTCALGQELFTITLPAVALFRTRLQSARRGCRLQ